MLTKTFTLSAIAVAFAATTHTVSAQEIDDSKKQLKPERITVTANRKENLDTDLAMSVDSVSSEELALDNGQHLAESLNSLSGVLINQLQGAQGHNAAIRMPINYGGYYLYLQDNIPLQSPAFFNHNALWWSSFNSNVGRLEVLKGAGTALYGSGAVAATVNIISQPNAQKPQTSIELSGAQNGYGKIGFSHSQAVNLQNSIRVSGSLLNNDGWREHTGSKRSEITLRHEYQISKTEQLVNTVIASDLEQEMAASLLEEDYLNDRTRSGLSEQVLATDPTRKSKYVRLSSAYTHHIDDELYFTLIPFYRHRTNNYTATWNNNMPKVESIVDSLGLLAMVGLDHQDGSETTFGVDVELSGGDQLSYQPMTITTAGWGGDTFNEGERFYDDTTRYLGISPYLQHRRELTDNLSLTAGLRYDYANYEFDNHLDTIGDIGHGAQSLANREDSFNHLSPKASLNYHLTDDSSIYLRYANSFRMPTASSLYHLKNRDSNTAISGINPEVSDTYETGYKVNFEPVSFDFALYSMNVDNAIVNAYDDLGVRYQTNAGKVSHKGVELSTQWQVNPSFDLSFAYTRTKHQFDEFVVDAGRVDDNGISNAKIYSGNTMKMAPKYVANIRLRYNPQPFNTFSSMLEFQSTGDYWMDDENSREYSGYTVANLKFRYQYSDQLSFNARIRNLTAKTYAQPIFVTLCAINDQNSKKIAIKILNVI
jgi:iron complex outermembrane receptor protein